jgi:pseudomonalisin
MKGTHTTMKQYFNTGRSATGQPAKPRRTAFALAAVISALLIALAVTAVSSAGASQTARTKLVPGALTEISRATFTGPAGSRRMMSVGVGVADRDPAAEHAFYSELYTKGSPEYHDFLTVKQFDQRFGATASTIAAVRSFLTSTGGKVTYASNSGDYFMVSGTVAQIDKLFRVRIGDYTYRGAHFISNNKAPSVPASLPITGTLGLDTYEKMTLDSLHGKQLAAAQTSERARVAAGRRVIAKDAATRHAEAAKTGAVTPAQEGSEMVFTPQDLWGMYDDPGASALTNANGTSTPSTLQSSTTALGQGQTIGVFGAGEMSSVIPQLRLFEAAEGLPKVPVRTVETEGAPDSAYDGFSADAVEWYLDSQSSTGMAPDAKQLDLYFAKNFYDQNVEDLFSDWAGDKNGPEEMNASFGECEGNPLEPVTEPAEGQLPISVAEGYSLETVTEASLEKASIEGRTLFTSAGDTGSGCPEIAAPVIGGGNGLVVQPVPEVGYPCASQYAVCVGGTVLSSKGTTYPASAQRDQETSWTYGGGGTSLFIPEASFQSKVTAINTPCLSQPNGTPYATTPTCRGVPDVADLSGNVDGDAYFIYTDGSPSSEGGTSLSSPLMMGQWARIQSAASAATQSGGGIGFADPTIYSVAAGADACNTGDLDSAQSELGVETPCTDSKYESDFYDITESEDAGDTAGVEGAGSIDGFNNLNTGVGTSNGAYFPAPGWDYDTGWGALNIANFMQTVDGTTTATDAYTGAEDPAIEVTTAAMTGFDGSAADPATGSDDPALDITGATLSATSSTITATLAVPHLASGPPADAVGGDIYYVMWSYGGKVYYATANDSSSGGWTFASGNTSDGIPEDNAASKATGTAANGVIQINVPASEVGSPAQCSLLTVPQALDAIGEGVSGAEDVNLLGTVDSSDNYRGYSVDGGQADSIAESVIVGGNTACAIATQSFPAVPVATTTTPTTTPVTTTTPTKTKTPVKHKATCVTNTTLPRTAITRKTLSPKLIKLSGTAYARCPAKVVTVGVSFAKTVIKQVGKRKVTYCEFLTAKHKWTKAGNCQPKDYLKAKGTTKWSYTLKLELTKGVYYIWEHATDSKKRTTKNVEKHHVFYRLK